MEQKQKQVSEFTDIELAELNGNLHQELMRVQTNLMAINQEIQRRKELVKGQQDKPKE